MVRALVASVLRRVLAWLVWSNEHTKDLEIVVLRHQLQVHTGSATTAGAANCW